MMVWSKRFGVLAVSMLCIFCTHAFAQQSGSFIDSRDKQKYRTVTIGDVTWMAQNLNFKMDDSWCYDNDESNCTKYGRLYTWGAAMKACPSGWSLPNNNYWNALVSTVGHRAGTKLKSGPPAWDGTNRFGFSALPGGYRHTNKIFYNVGERGYWWSASVNKRRQYYVHEWRMDTDEDDVEIGSSDEHDGYSVRCVRD